MQLFLIDFDFSNGIFWGETLQIIKKLSIPDLRIAFRIAFYGCSLSIEGTTISYPLRKLFKEERKKVFITRGRFHISKSAPDITSLIVIKMSVETWPKKIRHSKCDCIPFIPIKLKHDMFNYATSVNMNEIVLPGRDSTSRAGKYIQTFNTSRTTLS